ncbi:HD domain-containing protein [Sporosarcina sp. ITBMC105]
MQTIIQKCTMAVKNIYNEFDASHDFDHIVRVLKNAKQIAGTIPHADVSIITLAVLLHDIEDPKYQSVSAHSVSQILSQVGADEQTIETVQKTINSVSFNGGNERDITSIEGAIVRDADRLDAMGAIGIARTFAFGGARGRKLYDAEEVTRKDMTEAEYRSKETSSVTHFFEKLLLLKERMVTDEGKRLAEQRHTFMVTFLQQLSDETDLALDTR